MTQGFLFKKGMGAGVGGWLSASLTSPSSPATGACAGEASGNTAPPSGPTRMPEPPPLETEPTAGPAAAGGAAGAVALVAALAVASWDGATLSGLSICPVPDGPPGDKGEEDVALSDWPAVQEARGLLNLRTTLARPSRRGTEGGMAAPPAERARS